MEEKEFTKEAYEHIVHRRKPISINVSEFPAGDIGCGSGQNCSIIKGYVICFDIAEKQLLESRKKGCENLVQGDMEFLPFRNESFRTLIYIASIHHLRSPENAIIEGNRVLKHNGLIIITVWLVQFRYLFRRYIYKKSIINGNTYYRFYRLFYPWELLVLCKKYGFIIDMYKMYRKKSLFPNNSLCIGRKVNHKI